MHVIDDSSLKLVNQVSKAYQGLVVSIIITGSRMHGGGRDLDVAIIYDELAVSKKGRDSSSFEKELIEYVDEASRKLGFSGVKMEDKPATSSQVDLHILSLTSFWQLLEERNPYILSYLESGLAISDGGFFTTLQKIYDPGLMKPSKQAALAYF